MLRRATFSRYECLVGCRFESESDVACRRIYAMHPSGNENSIHAAHQGDCELSRVLVSIRVSLSGKKTICMCMSITQRISTSIQPVK